MRGLGWFALIWRWRERGFREREREEGRERVRLRPSLGGLKRSFMA